MKPMKPEFENQLMKQFAQRLESLEHRVGTLEASRSSSAESPSGLDSESRQLMRETIAHLRASSRSHSQPGTKK
jgi:hypothetical protein